MNQTQSRNFRRRNLIDGHVQGALCKRIFLHWCLFFVVVMLAISGTQILLGNPEQPLSVRVSQQLGQIFFFAVVLASLLPAFMLDTIRFSNRFVGPIARLRRHMRELADKGDTSTLQFREADYWGDVAKEFNAIRDKFRELRGHDETSTAGTVGDSGVKNPSRVR